MAEQNNQPAEILWKGHFPWESGLHMSNLISPAEKSFSQHQLGSITTKFSRLSARKFPLGPAGKNLWSGGKGLRLVYQHYDEETQLWHQLMQVTDGHCNEISGAGLQWSLQWCLAGYSDQKVYEELCSWAGSSDLYFQAEWRWHLTENIKAFKNWQNDVFVFFWGIQPSLIRL